MSSVSQLGRFATPQDETETYGSDQRSNHQAAASSKGTRPYSFTGMNGSYLLSVKVFKGTARLCKATQELGIEVLPVDKSA